MNSLEEVGDSIYNGQKRYLLYFPVDCVVFDYHDQKLKILLIRYHGQENLSLSGGYMERQEGLNAVAHRILSEKTHLGNLFL